MSGTDSIKALFFKRKGLKRSPKRKPILKQLDNYQEILVVSNEDKHYLLDIIASIFRHAKISFFHARSEKEDLSNNGTYTYHTSDLNLTGKIKSDKLNRLLQIQFDLILDLSNDEPLSLFFLQKLEHSFMIGKAGNEKSILYDLIIQENVSDEDYLKNIKEQITLLSQNKND